VPGLGLVDFDAAGLPATLAEKVEGELEVFASHLRHGLMSAAVNVGLDVFAPAAAGRRRRGGAGPKGKHDPDRRAVRHRSEPSKLPPGGRMLQVDKPRVRATDGSGEIPLETWAAVASREPLDRHTLISMLTGMSTRAYQSVLEPAGPHVDQAPSATSKSAVSRRFVETTRVRLEEFCSRPLGDRRWLVVYMTASTWPTKPWSAPWASTPTATSCP
jgi:hypothetical protein